MSLFRPAAADLPRDLPSLTGLRFVAAAWVLTLHFTDFLPVGYGRDVLFFDKGKLGVDFFFILSGFILTHVYLRDLESGQFDWLRFIWRRFARLYPIHIATLLVVIGYYLTGRLAGISFSVPEAYDPWALISNLMLVQAWGVEERMTWNYVSWSISAEWFAYLLFLPLSSALLRIRGHALLALAAAFAFFLLLVAVVPSVLGRPLTHLTYDFAILRILPEFVLGIALYHLARRHDLAPAAIVPALATSAGIVILIAATGGPDWLAIPALASIILTVASADRLGRARFLRHRVLVYLGEVSYSLYMTHAIVLIVFFKAADLLVGADRTVIVAISPLAFVAALLAAVLGYQLVEVPGRKRLNRIDPHAALPGAWRAIRGRAARSGFGAH